MSQRFRIRISDVLGGYAPDSTPPGQMVRFPTCDRKGDRSGWARLFDDGEGGVFGCWRQGISEVWQAREPKSEEERREFSERVIKNCEQTEKILAEIRAECRRKSAKLWQQSRSADQMHPYLLTKGVAPHRIRQIGMMLLVPIMGPDTIMRGLQFIGPDGAKKFKNGTEITGNYCCIGKPKGKTLLICEGYATAATIHESTGHAVAIAFSAGNMLPACESLRKKYTEWQLVVCADDDHVTPGNPGITKATEAARAVGGLLAVPDFSGTQRGAKDTDYNDLARLAGVEIVKRCVLSATAPKLIPSSKEDPLYGKTESRIKVVSAVDFLQMEFPPRKYLLSPWLPRQGLAMVYALRGIGKTYFALGVAYAVSCGGTFLSWEASAPQGVLFVDGEMPGADLQDRMARIVANSDRKPVAPLRILTPDLQPKGMIDLTKAADQQELEPYLEDVSLIVIDNLSTLARSGKENEGESWLPIQEWALHQRAAGRSVLFIHHAGKNGEQRGSSRREDVLDTVIALRRPGDYTPEKGACFEIHFEKARGAFGNATRPFEATLATSSDGRQEWLMKQVEDSTAEKVAKLLNEGIQQHEIAEMLSLTKGAVSKARKRAQEQGLITVS